MDARAMEDHDWDECGAEIADLFQADPIKQRAIKDAWWCDLDEEEQQDIHEFVCDNKRGPDGLEAVQQFEKYAADREKKLRDAEKAKQEKAARSFQQNPKAAISEEYSKLKATLDSTEEYAKFKRLLDERAQAMMDEASSRKWAW